MQIRVARPTGHLGRRSRTVEDQLVLCLESAERIARAVSRIRTAGFEPCVAANPY